MHPASGEIMCPTENSIAGGKLRIYRVSKQNVTLEIEKQTEWLHWPLRPIQPDIPFPVLPSVYWPGTESANRFP